MPAAVRPWRAWYHATGSTYGTWLRGDTRGWRSRHHREDVEGDYRSPPPDGTYDVELQQSRALMKYPAVIFTREQRELVCQYMVEALRFYNAEVAALCVGAKHFHLLARFTDCNIERPPATAGGKPTPIRRGRSKGAVHAFDVDPAPRIIVGKAKSWATRQLRQAGHFPRHPEGIWGKRPLIRPIESESHFVHLRDR